MLKLGVLLEACGIKSSADQVIKLESFVNFWIKKYYNKKDHIPDYYISKPDVSKPMVKVDLSKGEKTETQSKSGKETETSSKNVINWPKEDETVISKGKKSRQAIAMGPEGFQNPTTVLLKETDKEVEQEKEKEKDLESEKVEDFPTFYKSKSLTCPICSALCSYEELILHVKSCIEIKVKAWQKSQVHLGFQACKNCKNVFYRGTLSKHENVCQTVKQSNSLKTKRSNSKQIEFSMKILAENTENDKIEDESDNQLLELARQAENSEKFVLTKGLKNVKTENESEMETQDNDETYVDFESKVDLLEQAVSEIKGEAPDTKITPLFGSSKDNQEDVLASVYTCKMCPVSQKCDKDHITVQCKICQTDGEAKRGKGIPTYKSERESVRSNQYIIKHFEEYHPEEKYDGTQVNEMSLGPVDPSFHNRTYNVYKYQCYLCSRIMIHNPNFRKHFKVKHPTETYDKSKLIKMVAKTLTKRHGEPKITRPDFPMNSGDFECSQCQLRFQTDTLRNLHIEMTHNSTNIPLIINNEMEFTCPICTMKTTQSRIMPHVQYCEYKALEIAKGCQICGKNFAQKQYTSKRQVNATYDYHLKHLKMHENPETDPVVKNPFKCDQCQMRFPRSDSLSNHIKKIHKETKYICVTCGVIFETHQQLKDHKAKGHDDGTGVFKCHLCEKTYLSHKQLASHVYDHKNRNVFVTCEICDKSLSKTNYKKHKIGVHGEKIHSCPHCTMKFSMKKILERHIKVNHTRAFQCNLCAKRFGTERYLEDHKNGVHLKLRPFVCDLCHEGFRTKHEVAGHKRSAHSKDKPYQCSKCSKTFTTTVLLDHHIARVHELRNCETCPHCGKVFSRLQAHLLSCSVKGADRVVFQCTGCENTYLGKQALNRHMEKGQCEMKFSQTNQYVLKRTKFR